MNEENSLWMGDISPNMEESQIISSFRQYNFYPTHIKFIKDKKTNTNRNYCFVFFKNNEEAMRALNQLNGKKILNTNLSFKLNKASYHSPINRTVYVGNLNKNITDEALLTFFKMKYDSVIKATVLKEKNLSKGYGFVVFKKESEYKKCLIEMNGEVLLGKRIVVNEQKRKEDDDNSNISNSNSVNNNNFNNNNYNNNIIINNDYNLNAINNNNIDYLNNFVNNNINKDLLKNYILRNKNNINDMNVLTKLNIINNNALQNNDLKNNINNINNIINNNNIININNNVINQNNNILSYFDIDNNNIINNNLFKRFNNDTSIFEYYRNSSNDNNNKNIDTSKLFMNDNKINNNNMLLNFNKTFNNNNYDIKNNSVNFFNNSYNKTFSTNNNNNQNIINNINKPNKKVNIINNGNSINKSSINKNVKKKKSVIKLEILEKIDEKTLIKKIRDSINNTFNQFRKISSNGNNIKSKYILLFIYAFMLSF